MNTGEITICTNPPGAVIYVDSVLAEDVNRQPLLTPIKLGLYEGMHRFEMILSGYCDNIESVYIYENSDLLLERDLKPCSPPPGAVEEYAPKY